MKDAVIVSAVRTPVGKAKRGGLATVRPDEMAATTIQALLKRTPNLDPARIEDVVIGCAFPEGEQGLNMARMIALRAGLPDSVPAETINRYCASGVQSIAHVAYAIQASQIEVGIAGGSESMTMVPMAGYKFAPNPHFAVFGRTGRDILPTLYDRPLSDARGRATQPAEGILVSRGGASPRQAAQGTAAAHGRAD